MILHPDYFVDNDLKLRSNKITQLESFPLNRDMRNEMHTRKDSCS